MSNPSSNKELYSFLTKVYRTSVKKSLDIPKDEITEILSNLIKEHAAQYNLSSKSSVNNINYFDFKSRIKQEGSFSEKLIRKDIGLVMTHKHGKSLKDLKDKRVSIINDLKKLDDIIGIRIVTELKRDCENIYKILRENIAILEENEIVFYDIDDQPQKMKNGLNIFRIKGIYQDHICFELQIKSKIDEAWGEMDHTIFYKDHSSTPIKDTVQATMNNVGHLLEKIEDLLFDLRESNKKFHANNKYNLFQIKISQDLSEELYKIFGVSIDLKELTKSLFYIKTKIINKKNIDNRQLNFDHLNYENTDSELQYFEEAINQSHKLLIIESIFYNILRTSNNSFELTKENYTENFKSFYLHYIEYLTSGIIELRDFESLLNSTWSYISDPDLFVNRDKLEKFVAIKNHINNTLEGQNEAQKALSDLYFIQQYSGNIQKYIEFILENEDFDLSSKILQVQDEVKELPDNNNNNKNEWFRYSQHFLDIIKMINTNE